MIKVKTYVNDYDKNEFYKIMGKYFAERFYRKRLPYLINDNDKIWHLFYLKDELVGFAGLKSEDKLTTITDIYYVDDNIYNNVFEFIISYIVKTYNKNIIRVLSNNEDEIKIFKDFNFKIIGNRGSYINLELGDQNEEKNRISSTRR